MRCLSCALQELLQLAMQGPQCASWQHRGDTGRSESQPASSSFIGRLNELIQVVGCWCRIRCVWCTYISYMILIRAHFDYHPSSLVSSFVSNVKKDVDLGPLQHLGRCCRACWDVNSHAFCFLFSDMISQTVFCSSDNHGRFMICPCIRGTFVFPRFSKTEMSWHWQRAKTASGPVAVEWFEARVYPISVEICGWENTMYSSFYMLRCRQNYAPSSSWWIIQRSCNCMTFATIS